jgi:glucose/arabinose dehydrogenase
MHTKPNFPSRRSLRLAHSGALAAAALALSACDPGNPAVQAAQQGAAPELPAPRSYLLPPMKVAPAGNWKQGEAPVVPAPLKISPLVTGLMHPRFIYPLPNGDILIVEANGPKQPKMRPKDVIMGPIKAYGGTAVPGGNRITLLRPASGGAPELRTVFLDHLSSPFGVALVGNELYVANADSLMRYPYHEGDTRITAPGIKVMDLPGAEGKLNHHWTKSLLASPDGSKLYVGVGSNSNITENGMEAEMNRADILEVERASGAARVFASGLRNPNSMQWEPHTKAMWTVVNERDEIGPDLVPDYLTSVRDGGFYGWPYSYYGQHIDPRVMPQRPDLVAKAIVPDYALGSHVASLGLVFNNPANTTMPANLREGAFVGEHGSWDRSPPSGYKVVFVPFHDGKPAGKPIDVVTGFLKDGQAKGRPVGLAIDHSGALLVADDVGNTVWRVSAADSVADSVTDKR